MAEANLHHLSSIIRTLPNNPVYHRLITHYHSQIREIQHNTQLPDKLFWHGRSCVKCGNFYDETSKITIYGPGKAEKHIQRLSRGCFREKSKAGSLLRHLKRNNGMKLVQVCKHCTYVNKITRRIRSDVRSEEVKMIESNVKTTVKKKKVSKKYANLNEKVVKSLKVRIEKNKPPIEVSSEPSKTKKMNNLKQMKQLMKQPQKRADRNFLNLMTTVPE